MQDWLIAICIDSRSVRSGKHALDHTFYLLVLSHNKLWSVGFGGPLTPGTQSVMVTRSQI
jgi:hypothetical protein